MICLDERCPHFKSLKSDLNEENFYFCNSCMEEDHDHRPVGIIRKTMEIANKWYNLDLYLANT